MGTMNKVIGGLISIAGILAVVLSKDYILGLVLIIVGFVFTIFNQKEDEFQRRNDEKTNNNE